MKKWLVGLTIIAVALLASAGCTPVLSSAKLAIKLYEARDLIFETEQWHVSLKPDQTLLGSATIRLKRVESQFGELTNEETIELRDVVRAMEEAAKQRFGSSHLNWSCLMNHGYRTWPVPIALIHIHFHPRYMKKKARFAGIDFYDEHPTQHYKPYTMREVPESVRKEIIRAYREAITNQTGLVVISPKE